jgi:HPt (histidine-containing phosphotransfer) domain-containing protein
MIDWHDAALIDRERIEEFAEFLPGEQVALLVRAFTRELQTRPSMILHLVRTGDMANARAAAHLLKGAALSIGGSRIAALAAALEKAAEADVAALADELPLVALDTLADLDELDFARAA